MGKPPFKIIFIAGSSRSGSTLLDILLGSLPNFFSTGELYHIWVRGLKLNESCGCGQKFKECPFWNEVVHAAFGKLSESDLDHLIRLQKNHDSLRNLLFSQINNRFEPNALSVEYQGIFRNLFETIAKISGRNVIVDSSKFSPHGYALTRFSDSGATNYLSMIHLIRDSRAVAYSWYKIKKKRNPSDAVPLRVLYLLAFSRGWISWNVLADMLYGHVENKIRFRYEDLSVKPVEVLKEVLLALKFEDSISMIRDQAGYNPQSHHTVSGNPMRLSQKTIEVKPDLAWEENLPRLIKHGVTALTLPMLSKYGYLGGENNS